jgi:hypothetical protein
MENVAFWQKKKILIKTIFEDFHLILTKELRNFVANNKYELCFPNLAQKSWLDLATQDL